MKIKTNTIFLNDFYLCVYFLIFGCCVFLAVCRLSLVATSGDDSLAAVRGLLIVVASGCGARAPGMPGSVAVAHGLVARWHVGSS